VSTINSDERDERRLAERQARKDLIRDVVENTLKSFSEDQMNLHAESARWSIAYRIADNLCAELEPTIADMEEEIDSLWFMIDELKASDTSKNKGLGEEINKTIGVHLAKLQMMMNQKGDA